MPTDPSPEALDCPTVDGGTLDAPASPLGTSSTKGKGAEMKVGQVWLGRHTGDPWKVLWIGPTHDHEGDADRCLLSKLSPSGAVMEDECWDWVDRIQERWTLYESPNHSLAHEEHP